MKALAVLAAATSILSGTGAPVHHHMALGANLLKPRPGPASVVRADVCWECVQPTPGAWNWSYDNGLAHKLGSRWQPILDYAPVWATTPPGTYVPPPPKPPKPKTPSPPNYFVLHKPPLRIQAFASFAAAFVRRYHPHTIEVWNEPDIYVFWNAHNAGAAYAKLFVATYRAIKRASPKTLVLAAGLDEGNAGWFIPQMAPRMHGITPDGWSVHPYAATVATMQQLLISDARILRRYHIMAPFYVTEFGCWSLRPCLPASVFERDALPVLARDPDVVQADWWGNLSS